QLLSIDIIWFLGSNLMAACTPAPQKPLDIKPQRTIISPNNTPPDSRQLSAPRGVTRFWRLEK
ncbi:TPA: hypothetical protein ACF1KQ_004587, partial [Salmonella enterica subsp. enterica serovar London]|nr:hypothetical protein [Salmonella enterica]MDJ6185013.1 hypothetical protein [Salmonella enterica]MDJ7081850.1 hypothetical protein [Salmonella enterica]MDJ7320823.1 hypothetical protein [Salmonella enterica]MDJ7426958.1 hypothetical protein [Salmonella enterica]